MGGARAGQPHPEGNLGANLESNSHRCHPILVAFVWELTKETIELPMGCLQGGNLLGLFEDVARDARNEARHQPPRRLPDLPVLRRLPATLREIPRAGVKVGRGRRPVAMLVARRFGADGRHAPPPDKPASAGGCSHGQG